MKNTYRISLFFLFYAVACVIWTASLPINTMLCYSTLSVLMLIPLIVGFVDEIFLPLSLMVAIPIAAKLVALTIAPLNLNAQLIIIPSVLFSLGFSYTCKNIHWRTLVSKFRYVFGGLFFIVVSICIGFVVSFSVVPESIRYALPWIGHVSLLAYITVAEELVFRGSILAQAKKHIHPMFAILITSLLYGTLYSSTTNVIPFGIAFLACTIGSLLYYKTNRLLPVTIFTFIWKLASYLILNP